MAGRGRRRPAGLAPAAARRIGGMSSLVLDDGALVAVDRGDRAMAARLRVAQRSGISLRSNGAVVAQVWRDPAGRQVELARLLRAVDVKPVDERLGREA